MSFLRKNRLEGPRRNAQDSNIVEKKIGLSKIGT